MPVHYESLTRVTVTVHESESRKIENQGGDTFFGQRVLTRAAGLERLTRRGLAPAHPLSFRKSSNG